MTRHIVTATNNRPAVFIEISSREFKIRESEGANLYRGRSAQLTRKVHRFAAVLPQCWRIRNRVIEQGCPWTLDRPCFSRSRRGASIGLIKGANLRAPGLSVFINADLNCDAVHKSHSRKLGWEQRVVGWRRT